MAKANIIPNKNSRPLGRPRVETEQIGIRFSLDMIAKIDGWRRRQADLPIRTEAIRRLVEKALD